MRGFFCNRYGIRTLSAARRKRMYRCVCRFADFSPCNFFRKSLDKIKKSAIIKVRGNTGDGHFLLLVKITARHWECLGGYFFLFCISITNFTTASTNVPSRRSSSKVMYIGHHLPPKNRRKKKKFLRPPKSGGSNRHRQAVPAPNKICRMQTLSALRLSQQSNTCSVAWCFQGHGFLRGSFIIHPRRRFVNINPQDTPCGENPLSPQGLFYPRGIA